MSLYNIFKTNQDLETDGVWVEYGYHNGQPIRIKIARAGGRNTAFSKALEKETRPHRKAIQSGAMDSQAAERMYRKVFAHTVIKDWQNVSDAQGNVLPFSADNALKLLNDLPELYDDLREQANMMSLFREEVLSDSLGNSGKSSATDLNKNP